MEDYIKRLLIAGLMALCVSLLFIGGKHSKAEMLDIPEVTSHWIWPAEGVVTDLFGTRNGNHKGIDIAGDLETPIYTVDKGVVTKAYYSNTYGHVIFIKHDNNLETVYAHLNKRLVTEGQAVELGDMIGEMGNTGDSSGVHLHFEVHKQKWTYGKENAVNPEMAFGEGTIGQTVMALTKPRDYVSLEAISKLQVNEEGVQSVKIATKQSDTVERPTATKYIVSAGDTLFSIARKTNTTVASLKSLNNLSSDLIHPQQILVTK
jgi:murein DD-endopeptidase MepM/ murein hydrolase activator NlpD